MQTRGRSDECNDATRASVRSLARARHALKVSEPLRDGSFVVVHRELTQGTLRTVHRSYAMAPRSARALVSLPAILPGRSMSPLTVSLGAGRMAVQPQIIVARMSIAWSASADHETQR
jgi:hypothetical protein